MLFSAALYENQMVFLLSFMLFSVLFVTMIQTHLFLAPVKLETFEEQSGFQEGVKGVKVKVKDKWALLVVILDLVIDRFKFGASLPTHQN